MLAEATMTMAVGCLALLVFLDLETSGVVQTGTIICPCSKIGCFSSSISYQLPHLIATSFWLGAVSIEEGLSLWKITLFSLII